MAVMLGGEGAEEDREEVLRDMTVMLQDKITSRYDVLEEQQRDAARALAEFILDMNQSAEIRDVTHRETRQKTLANRCSDAVFGELKTAIFPEGAAPGTFNRQAIVATIVKKPAQPTVSGVMRSDWAMAGMRCKHSACITGKND